MVVLENSKFTVIVLLFISVVTVVSAIFKITRVECLTEDKSFVNVSLCRLKAVRRNVAEFSFRINLLQRVDSCRTHLQILRKYNGYKPFLFNNTLDMCYFIANRNKIGASYLEVLYKLVEQYTNVNHSCPYEGEIVFEKFAPQHKDLVLPWPTGEYLLKTDWSLNQKLRFRLNIWVVFEELEMWQKKLNPETSTKKICT